MNISMLIRRYFLGLALSWSVRLKNFQFCTIWSCVFSAASTNSNFYYPQLSRSIVILDRSKPHFFDNLVHRVSSLLFSLGLQHRGQLLYAYKISLERDSLGLGREQLLRVIILLRFKKRLLNLRQLLLVPCLPLRVINQSLCVTETEAVAAADDTESTPEERKYDDPQKT